MADSKKYEDYGFPLLRQGGWTRMGDDNDYVDYLPAANPLYYYRICTLDYVPQHHPNQITITGIASKELEVSVILLRSDNYIISSVGWRDNGYTFNLGSTYDKIGVMFRFKNGDRITPNDVTFDEVGTWYHSLRKLTTATEAVENPLYSDGTAITAYTIKGNTVQNGTPTPDNPVPVVGVGELETTGEHSGEYKIPISSGGVTTNIYLGSTQTTRRIKKLVVNGTESTWLEYNNLNLLRLPDTSRDYRSQVDGALCDSLPLVARGNLTANSFCWSTGTIGELIINVNNYNLADLKTYLSSNPITIWYVLATPETAAVNEPLMKIGTYADTLSNATAIPTTEGANSITVDTTVQPSEFTATWSGWHNANVKEWDGSQWNE